MNHNGSNGHAPIPMPGRNGVAVVGQQQTIDLKQIAKDASKGAAQIVLEMKEAGELAQGLEVATYQVVMELLLTPIKASIQVSAQLQAQQAAMRAQGLIV